MTVEDIEAATRLHNLGLMSTDEYADMILEYGRHTPACKHIMEHNKNINCSCGYGKAMKSETPERR